MRIDVKEIATAAEAAGWEAPEGLSSVWYFERAKAELARAFWYCVSASYSYPRRTHRADARRLSWGIANSLRDLGRLGDDSLVRWLNLPSDERAAQAEALSKHDLPDSERLIDEVIRMAIRLRFEMALLSSQGRFQKRAKLLINSMLRLEKVASEVMEDLRDPFGTLARARTHDAGAGVGRVARRTRGDDVPGLWLQAVGPKVKESKGEELHASARPTRAPTRDPREAESWDDGWE